MSTRSTPLKAAVAQSANGGRYGYHGTPGDQGTIVRVAGSVVAVRGLERARLNDVVLIGDRRLPGEIIRLAGEMAVAQVYEPANGLRAGDPVTATGQPLSVELGPGLLGSIVDGTARPLAGLAAMIMPGPSLTAG